jgi:hypothetical protein
MHCKNTWSFAGYHGENTTGESWLVRDIWQISDVKIRGGRTGLATHPQKIKIDAIKVIIIRALYEQGVREALPEWQRRHEFKGAHGFRKFFKTHAEQFMNHSNVELLLGHSADALQASYYKPTESDVLNDYLKAVDILTIDYDKNTLTKQVAELKEKSKKDSYIIKGNLAEKEKETEQTMKILEDTARELAELRAIQEKAAKRQQMEIDQIKDMMMGTKNNNATREGNLLRYYWELASKRNEQKFKEATAQLQREGKQVSD